MSNILAVHLYTKEAHVVVYVEEQPDDTFTLTILVNGKVQLGPVDGFASPQDALDHALSKHNPQYPITGAYVEGGQGALDASAADDFIGALDSKGFKAFRKFLDTLRTQYNIVPATEAEYRAAHTVWANGSSVLEAAMAINKLRNGPKP